MLILIQSVWGGAWKPWDSVFLISPQFWIARIWKEYSRLGTEAATEPEPDIGSVWEYVYTGQMVEK